MGVLRFLLAISVVAVHCGGYFGQHLVDAQISVQAFYIISGFYMTLILNEKYIGASGKYKLFISNRLLRLFPIYWVTLVLTVLTCIGVALISGPGKSLIIQNYISTNHSLWSVLVLGFTNIFILGSDAIMFVWLNPVTGLFEFTLNYWTTNPPTWSFMFIPPAWTVGLEILFYSIAPFIVKQKKAIVFTILLFSIFLRLYLFNILNLKNDPWSYRFFPTELVFFLLGYFSYHIYSRIKLTEVKLLFSKILLIISIIFCLFYPLIYDVQPSYLPFSLKEIIFFVFLVFSIPFLFKYTKSNKLDAKIGDLSYPIYLVHLLIAQWCNIINIKFFNSGISILFFTIIFSILLNQLVANPIEKFRQSRVR